MKAASVETPALAADLAAGNSNSKFCMKRLLFFSFPLLLPAGSQIGDRGGSSSSVPEGAIDACLQNADAYQKTASGTATFSGVVEGHVAVGNPAAAGGNWALRVTVTGLPCCAMSLRQSIVQSVQPL